VVNERGTTISRHNSLAEAQAAAAKRGESFSVKGGKYARGVVVEFSENITENLENKVLAALGEGAGFTRISNNQIAIINFRDDSTGVPFVDDETFMGGVQSFLDNHGADLGVAEAKSMWAEGEYGYVHNWSEDGNGETILDQIYNGGFVIGGQTSKVLSSNTRAKTSSSVSKKSRNSKSSVE